MSWPVNGVWFTTSTWWGPGVYLVQTFGRDLGRVARETDGTWSGWKESRPKPGSGREADVEGIRTRQEAGEALKELWEDSHGPVTNSARQR